MLFPYLGKNLNTDNKSHDSDDSDASYDIENDIEEVLSDEKRYISDIVDDNKYIFSDDKLMEKDRLLSEVRTKYEKHILLKLNKMNKEMADLKDKGCIPPVIQETRNRRLQILRQDINNKIRRKFVYI